MAYAALGIPLMLLYLSCMGGLLSRAARVIFRHRSRSNTESRADSGRLPVRCCCCVPAEEKGSREANSTAAQPTADMTATIRRSRGFAASSGAAEYREKLRALSPGEEELKAMAGAVEDGGASSATQTTACCSSASSTAASPASASSPASSPTPPRSPSCLAAPLIICLCAVVLYVAAGAAVLSRWERWPFLDAAYFCFMSLSTIGFGEMMPGAGQSTTFHSPTGVRMGAGNATVWFVSLYILAGMALTATCFNILHDEIMQRLKHKYRSTTSPPQQPALPAANGVASSRKEGDEDPYS